MVESCMPTEAAVVAAPMRKLTSIEVSWNVSCDQAFTDMINKLCLGQWLLVSPAK